MYFAARDGLIKIGCSGDVQRRLRGLGPGIQLLAVGACDAYRLDVELNVHHEFADLHVGHEWFRPEPALLAFIENVAATGVIPAHLDTWRRGRGVKLLTVRGPRKMKRLHWMRRKVLRRARLLLTLGALIERHVAAEVSP